MNKWVFLAVAATCLVLCAASPVKRSSAEGGQEAVKSSRQDAGEVPAVVEAAVAAPAAPVAPVAAPAAPAASAEDDDDDDDDYDVGVGDDDDDDEDEEEEEDDDDEDYLERFFEDLLGDDDEDDEPVGAGATLQAVQPPQLIGSAGGSGNAVPLAVAPAPPPAPAATPINNEVVTTLEASVISPESDSPVYDDEDDEVTSSGAEEGEGSFEEDDGRQPEVAETQPAVAAAPAPVAVAPVAAQEAAVDEDEDDDDDEEDLGVGDLTDDDDDDDEEDDEEDEDEDEDEGGDEDDDDDDDDDYDTVASRARALDLNGTGRIPASLYVSKYNRYVDSILERIRKVLRKSFDPVNVRLHSTTRVKNNSNKNKVKTGNKGPKEGRTTLERQLQEESLLKAQMMSSEANFEEQQPRRRGGGGGGSGGGGSGGGGSGGHGSKPQRPNRPQNQNQNNKTKNKGKNRPRAKATLMGLSSIRREGDVSVNLMSTHTSVRSNFLLGPLILKVEKEFGRGETKELRSASAVTEEMAGTMGLRISPEGIASLHNIRVLQPKQVRVESADDHDRTREFVWRRSSHIARLVSRKLAAAARSMLGTQKTDRMLAEEGKSLVQAQANLYSSEMGQVHS